MGPIRIERYPGLAWDKYGLNRRDGGTMQKVGVAPDYCGRSREMSVVRGLERRMAEELSVPTCA